MADSKYYTVDDLITSVTRRGSVPISDKTINDDDIIRFANEEVSESIVALILSCREEIYLTYEDVPVVSSSQTYSIPYRAIGSKIRIIKPMFSGKEGAPLVPVPLDRAYDYEANAYSNSFRGFYLKNDQIVIIPPVGSLGTQTLRIYYYLRPNDIVPVDQGAVIKTIDSVNNVVTVQAMPSTILNGNLVDIIQAKPNHKTRAWDQSPVINTSNKTFTFDSLPEGLEVGDYICNAGETITPQIPVDILPLLEQATVCKVLEAIGDTEGLKNAYVRLASLEKRLFNVIDNRIESPGKKVVNTNSFLRRNYRRFS